MPLVESINRTLLFESECDLPFEIRGRNLELFYDYLLGDSRLICNSNSTQVLTCMINSCKDIL